MACGSSNRLFFLKFGNFAMPRQIVAAILISFFGVARLPCSADAAIITFGSGENEFNIEFAEIANPGNSGDGDGNPVAAGQVAYSYRIAKHETSWDMVNKFNASQTLEITHDSRDAGKPSTRIDWNEAARFVNWLNTSEGYQAAYRFDTDELDDNLTVWDPSEAWQSGGTNLFRHKNAKYWLPSVDEWHKAAYYDPNTETYSDYPTLSGFAPYAVSSGTTANTAVYSQSFLSGPADVTESGGLSPYGVMGLGGNAFEWTETSSDLQNSSGDSERIFRGGRWNSNLSLLRSSSAFQGNPIATVTGLGFRVASVTNFASSSNSSVAAVPEPSTLAIWSFISVSILLHRRRGISKARRVSRSAPGVTQA